MALRHQFVVGLVAGMAASSLAVRLDARDSPTTYVQAAPLTDCLRTRHAPRSDAHRVTCVLARTPLLIFARTDERDTMRHRTRQITKGGDDTSDPACHLLRTGMDCV
jgi:hypothetical protein